MSIDLITKNENENDIIHPFEMRYNVAYQKFEEQGEDYPFFIFLDHGEKDCEEFTTILEIEICGNLITNITKNSLHEDEKLVESYRSINIRIFGRGRIK